MFSKFNNGIVLTGSIATGKSTVASLLKLYGYTIIDADEISHRVLKMNSSKIGIVFEDALVNGIIDRKKLGEIVFNDKEKLKILENLLHPMIKEEILKEAKYLEPFNIPYFVDIPLFYEKKNYNFKKVVVVYTPKELQIERLMKRNKLSLEEAVKRIDLQMDIEEKKRLADYVIDNSKDLKHLQKEVDKFIKELDKLL